jgi:hypothetical protein
MSAVETFSPHPKSRYTKSAKEITQRIMVV